MTTGLREVDFAFTVSACGLDWQVYRFVKDGKRGTLAFTKTPQGQWIIGLFAPGDLTPEQVERKLVENEN